MPGDYTTRHAAHIEDRTEEEKEQRKVDEGGDIQERRIISKDLAPALTKEEQSEEAKQDKIYQKPKAAVKEDKKHKDRDLVPHKAVGEEQRRNNRHHNLVVIDDHTRHTEEAEVKGTRAEDDIQAFPEVFSRHGIPRRHHSDNDAAFSGKDSHMPQKYLTNKGNKHVTNKGAKDPEAMGLVEAYRRCDGEGQGRDVRGQDNAEMHELFVTPDRVYYLLAGPRLAEAHDSSTVVPLTGSARSAPKPLTISNLLYSQHQSDDQHKDVMNEPSIKTRLAQFVSMNRQPVNVLPKGMRPPSTTTTSTGIGRSPRTPSLMTAAGVRACTRPAAMTAAGRTGSRTEGTANPSRGCGASGHAQDWGRWASGRAGHIRG